MTTLMLSSAPHSTSSATDSGNDVDSPNPTVAAPNSATTINSTLPRPMPRRDPPADQRHRDRADRLRRAQDAVADRPDVEHVLRDRGQEGRHPGEQHREHVERERGQEQRRLEDEPQADPPVAARRRGTGHGLDRARLRQRAIEDRGCEASRPRPPHRSPTARTPRARGPRASDRRSARAPTGSTRRDSRAGGPRDR